MKRTMLSLSLALSLAAVGSIGGAVGGMSVAHATEITGTLGTTGGSSGGATTTNSALAGTVTGGTPENGGGSQTSGSASSTSNSQLAAGGSGGGGSAATSGHRHTGTASYAPAAMQSDGSLAQAPDYTGNSSGVGGGYDPTLDRYLASLQGTPGSQTVVRSGISSSALSPQGAIAYNTQLSAVGDQIDAAAAAAAPGSSMSRVIVLALMGAAVIALGAYAVHAYTAYRKERGS